MKFIFIVLLFLPFYANAYDAKITDKYGRTTGYVKGNEVTNKYGRTEKYIKKDGKITDKYGKTKGYIKKK